MTASEPYLVLRDFRVWFTKHRGFLQSLRRTDPGWIKAVDGINITIGKGEIYCLVGESGCGKTTTGKGILRLVEPTGGDVFLNPTSEELQKFEEDLRKKNEDAVEAFRYRKALNYKEKPHRTWLDYAKHVLLAVAGTVVAGIMGWLCILGFRAIGYPSLESLAFIAVGLVFAMVTTLPWIKMSTRAKYALSLGAIAPGVVAQALGTYSAQVRAGLASDLGTVLSVYGGNLQENYLFVALGQFFFAAVAMWVSSGYLVRFWDQRRGVVTDRLRKLRTRLQIIFQDPYESLNPRHTIYDIVAEPLLVNRVTRGRAETAARVERALEDAGLRPPREYLLRFPHELSGGQRQRVGIAGALVLEPEFLVADEPVSMLDVSIRTEIIELLMQLRTKRQLTYLFITHDLSLAWVLADRVGVMYLGKIVEEGPTEQLIGNPRHPYTKALISVVPAADPERKHDRTILKGERPDPSDIPPGCRFHPRCPVAFERCGWTSQELLADLKEMGSSEDASQLDGAVFRDSRALILPNAKPEFEASLQEAIATKSEQWRALKAIQSVERQGAGVRIGLHAFEEPTLHTVAAGLSVACHLYT